MMRETQSLVLECHVESRSSPNEVGFVQRHASYTEEGGTLHSQHVHQLSPQLLVWLHRTLYPSEKTVPCLSFSNLSFPAQSLGFG